MKTQALLITVLSLITFNGWGFSANDCQDDIESVDLMEIEGTKLETMRVGDVITFHDGTTKRVNIIRVKNNSIVYLPYNSKYGEKNKISRWDVASIEFDGVVQLKQNGFVSEYEVVEIEEGDLHTKLQGGRSLITAGFINGGIGLVGIGVMTAGFFTGSEGASGGGFVTAVFGSRSWLPSFIAGGTILRKNKKKYLKKLKEPTFVVSE